jgi:hypothetical protein
MPSGNWTAELSACQGCGLTAGSGREHRPDCTVEPSPMMCAGPDCDEIRLPSQKRPVWSLDPRTGEYHCPTHQNGIHQ